MLARLLALALAASILVAPPAQSAEAPASPQPTAEPEPPPAVERIVMVQRPQVIGVSRYGKTLRRTVGRYSVRGVSQRTQWLRDGKPIKGATKKRYTIRPRDVGHKIRVRVTISKPGHRTITPLSRSRKAKHLRSVRHTVAYTIASNGAISASMKTFRRQVAQTLDDPRGWRAAGIAFKRVKSGGSMTIVLAQASRVPWYSSGCSAAWSCRVGRYVIINQDRWKHATPAWNSGKGTTLRGYRHMVVNHEVGHWLGWWHASCGGAGRKAPIMMQQSKGRNGCAFNAWPLPSERSVPRYR